MNLFERFNERLADCAEDFFMGDMTIHEVELIKDELNKINYTNIKIKSEREVSEDKSFHHLFCIFAEKN
jgi:hypothetical protein